MKNRLRGFTLIELLVVITIIGLLVGILLPALGKARLSSRNLQSLSNMRQLNVARENYSATFGFLYSPSWNRRNTDEWLYKAEDAGLDRYLGASANNTGAQALQYTEIMRRLTGRGEGARLSNGNLVQMNPVTGYLKNRRFLHIIIADFLTNTLPEPIFVNPNNRDLALWSREEFWGGLDRGYLVAPNEGLPDNPSGLWDRSKSGVPQWFPYGSSYISTTASWSRDGLPGQPFPVGTTADHTLVNVGPVGAPLVQRRSEEVAFPSSKVHLFEEYDWRSDNQLFFGYDDANVNVAFFDGSARSETTINANEGWNPISNDYASNPEPYRVEYFPIDSRLFPAPARPGDEVVGHFRWTRGGLKGIDFGGDEIDTGQYETRNANPDNQL